MSLFLCLSGISLGRYCQKSSAKIGEFGKKIKREGWPYRVVRGLSVEGGFQTFSTLRSVTSPKPHHQLWHRLHHIVSYKGRTYFVI